MNSEEYVKQQILAMKNKGVPLSDVAWEAAKECVGWAYVFGARGQEDTPALRRQRYNATPAGKDKDNIKDKCKNFDGTGTCSGCQWYPNNQRTCCFDCRGFTYWILLQVYGWKLQGAGCTSQWNTESNWAAKGTIDSIPEDKLVCLFYPSPKDPKVMEHTGLGYHGETVECSNGVQYFSKRNKKWTHWALPKCAGGDEPMPDQKPTLRKGDSGSYVTLLQEMLMQRSYALPKYGADGKYGNETVNAVKAFQRDNGLKVDGICGPATWAAMDATQSGPEPKPEPAEDRYTVTIPGVTLQQAEEICKEWSGAKKKKE